MDIADELNNELPYSGGPFILDEFDAGAGEATFAKNPDYWDEDTTALLDGFTMIAQADCDTELNALLAGEVAAIYPQPAPGIADTARRWRHRRVTSSAPAPPSRVCGSTWSSLIEPEHGAEGPASARPLLFAVDRGSILSEVITPSFPETEHPELRWLGPDGG